MLYKLLADGVVFLHLVYVGFVVVAQLLIIVGLLARWQWVRNLRFRVIHLVMVEVVALEGYFGIICPMTDWDAQLRARTRDDNLVAAQPAKPPPVNLPPVEPPPVQPPAVEPAPPKSEPAAVPPAQPPKAPEPAADFVPPAMAGAPGDPPADEGESTFVGKLLSSILYLEVPQTVLDKWYVRFGLITLGLFLLFPPTFGAWTSYGLTGMILVWTGVLFSCTAVHALITRPAATPIIEQRDGASSNWQRYQPLTLGIVMTLAGVACGWWGRSKAVRTTEETGNEAQTS